MHNLPSATKLIDNFGRTIDYLRISVTDRCNFRCIYCMPETMTFLPRTQILTIEEIIYIANVFVELGIKKIRITGGEPLLRQNVLKLLQNLGKNKLLEELAITTNGSKMEEMATPLKQAGVKRVNISLDTLDTNKFKQITRTGDLKKTLNGIYVAKKVGFARIKINAVILKNYNHTEVVNLLQFAVDNEIDISFIEEMPLGIIDSHDRNAMYYSSDSIKKDLEKYFKLVSTPEVTAGPSTYFKVLGTNTKAGFISPHSANFCNACNRVRLTAQGQLLLCLGNEHSVNLKNIIRTSSNTTKKLKQVIINSMQIKPKKHEFTLKEQPVILRYMNTTGG